MYRVARAARKKDGLADKERERGREGGREREIRALYNSSGHLMIQLVRFPSAPRLYLCQRRLLFYIPPPPHPPPFLSLSLSQTAAGSTNHERRESDAS